MIRSSIPVVLETPAWNRWIDEFSRKLGPDWHTQAMDLAGNEAYPNVYVDISYFWKDSSELHSALVRLFRDVYGPQARRPQLRRKLLLGTDWIVSEVEGTSALAFWRTVRHAFGEAVPPGERLTFWEAISSRNALDFLNLRKGRFTQWERYFEQAGAGEHCYTVGMQPWWKQVKRWYDQGSPPRDPKGPRPRRSAFLLEVEKQRTLVNKLESANPHGYPLFFLKTQARILESIEARYGRRSDGEVEWLAKVVGMFMAPVHLALEGRIAKKSQNSLENARLWCSIGESQLAGFWWTTALDELEKISHFPFDKPFPAPQQHEMAAYPFVLAHIWYDLRLALFQCGPGSDEMWMEVEQLVLAAMSETMGYPRSMLDALILVSKVVPPLNRFNPVTLRNSMRRQLKALLKANEAIDPYRGIKIDGVPPPGAFPTFCGQFE